MRQNKILFATSFSDRDLDAFHSSCLLARQWNATLYIVYVQDPREPVKPPSARAAPEREFARFQPVDLGIEFSHHVLVGEAADKILEFADQEKVSLIVLGTHGRVGLERFLYGSVAETVMRNAKCPVMTRREKTGLGGSKDMEKILVPIDFSVYGYAAIDFASQIALLTSAELTICYVEEEEAASATEDGSQSQEELWSRLTEFKPTNSKVRFQHKLFYGDPGKEICSYANAKLYDYVVIGTHGRSGLSRAIMGSVAEHVVRCSDCPVISVKPSNRRANVVC